MSYSPTLNWASIFTAAALCARVEAMGAAIG